jgi:S-phase kinase-associated protein 1
MDADGMITLVSKEGDAYEVPMAVAKMSVLVADTFDADEDDDEAEPVKDFPLPNVTSGVLEKVIEFCKHFQEEPMTTIQTPLKSSKLEDLVQQWYADFVKVPKTLLFDLVAAANYMDIKPLLDLTCLAVSILIKGKSAAELRSMFNLSDELSHEEEAQMAQGNQQFADRAQEAAAANTGEGVNVVPSEGMAQDEKN